MFRKCYFASNSGKIRTNNEDCIQINKLVISKEIDKRGSILIGNHSLISVCDGMGGEEFGEIASFKAASKLASLKPKSINQDNMFNAIREVNDDICSEMSNMNVRMGSTLVSVLFKGNLIDIYNLGDSRCYIYGSELIQLSKDHTVEKLNGNKKGALTQHLGIYKDEVEIEPFVIDNIELKKNNYLLLCSDGLYDMVPKDEIGNILSLKIKDEEKRDKLMERALENGGKDNISFLLVRG